ncbi:MAG: tRNA uridine-5-carboxymethylaminomethyl(34) synthesis GTPase MnmE [Acidobacteria bacterium]|nr:tRNA uridine-5-carboxymethylaminomethyl(34) synthesis GTPase MnmE [Acidobacteriota bacterium]
MSHAHDRDTIVAPATPPGRAALAVVRLSGPAAREVAARVFRPLRATSLPRRRAVLGDVVDRAGQAIDRGMALFHPAPGSYTGEDLVELSVHGSPAVVRELLAAAEAAGARLAEPGEFTLRALRAGKIDLAQAEAVRDLVEAATAEQARLAARQLAGEVSGVVGALAERVFDLLAEIEAGLDFSDEEDVASCRDDLAARAARLIEEIDALLAGSELARRVREGARVVLLGPPNAGKSSLFNALVGEARVIVTGEPGTTRDLIEETVVLDGLPVVLVDAAGVGAARGEAERAGMARALEAARSANLVLDVYDLGGNYRPSPADRPSLPVGTHADLPWQLPPVPGSVLVSSVTGAGVPELRRAIAAGLDAPGSRPIESIAFATARHHAAARRARGSLDAARELLAAGAGAELAAVELRAAVGALHEILGAIGPEDLLGRIFSRFCIGK